MYPSADPVTVAPDYDFIMHRLAVGNFQSRSLPNWTMVVSVVTMEELHDGTHDFSKNLIDVENCSFLFLPVKDGEVESNYKSQLKATVRAIRKHIDENPDAEVLIHCMAGMSRSVSVAIAYLCSCGMSPLEAKSFVCERRKIAAPYDGFMDAIKGLWGPK